MSVGHIARLLEDAGIATVIIAVKAFLPRMKAMTLPRVLLTPHLLGRPIGPPNDNVTQRAVLEAALELLATADGPGAILEFS
jgi:hypothetical protein